MRPAPRRGSGAGALFSPPRSAPRALYAPCWKALNSDSRSRPDGGIGTTISADLSTSTIGSGSVSSEPNP
jgi:hypothetical protein